MADTKKTQAVVKLHALEPRATEKTYFEQAKRTYVFPVKKSMTKQEIAKLVEKEFSVTVTDVRVLTRKGKKTKFSKGKHAYPGIAFRQDKKFAYVTLKDGDSIKVFEEAEDKDKKADKKAVKADAKEAKKADKNASKEKK
ncbi:50S ribosomal protein L23 [Candidatus Saccharibacteria bacterium]|nr:50S ribosomal protein L23 [Candidatus Saccharibacteria bacterium]